MMYQALGRSFCGDCAKQGFADQLLCHPCRHGIADNIFGEDVLMPGKIEPSFVGRDIRYVRHPHLIRHRRLKLLVQKILGYWMSML